MKILVIGLDCAAPEVLFSDEALGNVRRLMGNGCYGRLESIIPPITVPAWMCMATGQDPGSLGVYGFRNRLDHSYSRLGLVDSRSITELSVWDQVAREGGRSVIIGISRMTRNAFGSSVENWSTQVAPSMCACTTSPSTVTTSPAREPAACQGMTSYARTSAHVALSHAAHASASQSGLRARMAALP